MKNEAKFIRFALPSGQVVDVAADVSRFDSYITFQMADGRIVLAVRCPGQR